MKSMQKGNTEPQPWSEPVSARTEQFDEGDVYCFVFLKRRINRRVFNNNCIESQAKEEVGQFFAANVSVEPQIIACASVR